LQIATGYVERVIPFDDAKPEAVIATKIRAITRKDQ
jgi:hypothetical protein